MAPAAAALLVTVGIYVRQHSISLQLARNEAAAAVSEQPVSDSAIAGLNDDDLLQEIAQQSPALQGSIRQTIFAASTSTFRMRKAWSPPIRTTRKLAAR